MLSCLLSWANVFIQDVTQCWCRLCLREQRQPQIHQYNLEKAKTLLINQVRQNTNGPKLCEWEGDIRKVFETKINRFPHQSLALWLSSASVSKSSIKLTRKTPQLQFFFHILHMSKFRAVVRWCGIQGDKRWLFFSHPHCFSHLSLRSRHQLNTGCLSQESLIHRASLLTACS